MKPFVSTSLPDHAVKYTVAANAPAYIAVLHRRYDIVLEARGVQSESLRDTDDMLRTAKESSSCSTPHPRRTMARKVKVTENRSFARCSTVLRSNELPCSNEQNKE